VLTLGAQREYKSGMSTLPLHHVSYVTRGSMAGPQVVSYFSVAAPTSGTALDVVSAHLGHPSVGEFTVAPTKGRAAADGPSIVLCYVDDPV
jgi:hypothetical protein